MSFPPDVADEVLVLCGRHCCLCHKFAGGKMELHHIAQRAKGGKDSLDNCIPLCFDCHAEVGNYNVEHPKGRKFSPKELRKHRDNWFEKVKKPQTQESNKDTREASDISQTVIGEGNMVAGGDIINNLNQKKIIKNNILPDRGGRHITEQEAYQIYKNVQTYSKLMKDAGLDPNPAKVWKRLKEKFQVTTYKEIPFGCADEAIKIVQQETAKARPKVRRRNPDAWRNSYYKPIWAGAKQLGLSKDDIYKIANELSSKKNINSLKDLTQKQLQQLDDKVKQLKSKQGLK
ncbi:MAG: HNH endonuclease [Thiotrichaceae bacterium]|nr:HNH endonuclease [Thiotrichaceae bacterium]